MKILSRLVLAGFLTAASLPAAAQGAESAGDLVLTASDVDLRSDDLESENLRLHTVQRKLYSDGGLHEVALFPAIFQLNSKFTNHLGAGAQYLYHLHESFSVQVMGQYYYMNQQAGFVQDMIDTAQIQPQPATALTLQWAATGGFEVTPIYGKIAIYDGKIAHFGLVLSGGAGIGGTRIQLSGEDDEGGRVFGDAGTRFVGQIGAGFRVRFDQSFVARLEVRDLVYTAQVDTINGCTFTDFEALEANGTASGSCKAGGMSEAARTRAQELIRKPSSDVLNNLGIYAGISYIF